MLDISKDIDSLTQFKRNTVSFLKRLSKTGRPVVLTVNGKAQVVVQDAESYQRLLEVVDRLETIEQIREGIKSIEEGRGLTLNEAKEKVRKKHGISV